jgi:hypothetical protein
MILGIIVFLVGLGILSFVEWYINGIAGDRSIEWYMVQRGIVNSGSQLIIGIALVTIGMIVVLFAKSDK